MPKSGPQGVIFVLCVFFCVFFRRRCFVASFLQLLLFACLNENLSFFNLHRRPEALLAAVFLSHVLLS